MTACGGRPSTGYKLALLTLGPVSDVAWNAGAYEGLPRIRDSLGGQVAHVETKPPAEFEEAFRDFASRGYRLVFGHGFEFQDTAARVGADLPISIFITTSGSRVRANVAPMVFPVEEGTYLAGMPAAGISRTGKLGFVGGTELFPVEGAYLDFAGGAKAVRPDVEVTEAYLGNFQGVAAAKESALAQIRRGADVILHNAGAASLGVFQVARDSIVAGTLRVPSVEFVPDSVPVARR